MGEHVNDRSALTQTYFCIGAAKTGTTILARLLDQQPDVACVWESYILRPRHASSIVNPESPAWQKHGLSLEQVRDWNARAIAQVEHDGATKDAIRVPETLRAITLELFESFGASMNASVVGDKWPYYHQRLALLLEAFPDAKFVYNVRDPRAVWNSGHTFRKREMGDEILADMLQADRRVRPYLDDDRFITVRYEDLITDANRTLERLADFLGFRFDAAAIEYDPSADPLPKRWNWVPQARGDLDVGMTEKWRTEMPDDVQRRVTDEHHDFLTRYGYR